MHYTSALWAVWAIVLSLGWLLPNHYQPWSSFHSEAWIALCLMPAGSYVLLGRGAHLRLTALSLILLTFIGIPIAQYSVGLVLQSQTMWLAVAYGLGLFAAVQVGMVADRGRSDALLNALFVAIAIASCFSVLLQWMQWLQLGGNSIWSWGHEYPRPFGNLGQPNQLGTLHMWGLVAIAWAYTRSALSGSVAISLATIVVTGVVMTESRTAWVNIGVLVLASWVWRKHWPVRKFPHIVTVLAAIAGLITYIYPSLSQSLHLRGEASNEIARVTQLGSDLRPAVWEMFARAIAENPWIGYGWNQGRLAHLSVAHQYPQLHQLFGYTHNIVLDLVVWNGVPVGLGLAGFLIVWFVRTICAVRDAESALLVSFLAVFGVHAMLELPHHYAYFLLPVGLVMGALEWRQRSRVIFRMGLAGTVVTLIFAVSLYAAIVSDYLQVEARYTSLRMRWAGLATANPVGQSPLWVLGDWDSFLRFANQAWSAPFSASDLPWMETVAKSFPSMPVISTFARTLAENGRTAEASDWLAKGCAVSPERDCLQAKKRWIALQAASPVYRLVNLPQE